MLASATVLLGGPPGPSRAQVWTFDRLDKINGIPAIVVGHPRLIKTPLGKAIQFNGIEDALFIAKHPLAGAETFSFEAIFRPEAGGAPDYRDRA